MAKETGINPNPPSRVAAGSVPRLTKDQAVIISAYTGWLCCDFGDMHGEIERRLGQPVCTHEMPAIMDTEIRPAFKDSFIALSPNVKVSDGSQPPLTCDLSLSESAGSRSLHRLVGRGWCAVPRTSPG